MAGRYALKIFSIGCAAYLLTACGVTSPAVSTEAPTPISSPTHTPAPESTPTPTATATPEPGIDMEKFNTMPPNYEYLLAHPDEFVKAPDPLTDRAAFDKWYSEELIPALGPVSERPLTADTSRSGQSRYTFTAKSDGYAIPLIGQPKFFYFENAGTIYPVPCMNFTNNAYPRVTRITFCTALSDYIPLSRAGTNSLEMFASPTDFASNEIYLDLSISPDVDWGRLVELVPSLGEYIDDDNSVVFGFGRIVFDRNY